MAWTVRAGNQRLAVHHVEMNRTGGHSCCPVHGLIRRGEHDRRVDSRIRGGQVELPPHIVSENLYLVDGLIGAGSPQFRGAIRRNEQHRHCVHRRFHHGGHTVCHRRSGGCNPRSGASGGAPVPESAERGTPFVIVHDALCPGMGRHGKRQRSAPGARCDAEQADAGANQLFNEKIGPYLVDAGWFGIGHVHRCISSA